MIRSILGEIRAKQGGNLNKFSDFFEIFAKRFRPFCTFSKIWPRFLGPTLPVRTSSYSNFQPHFPFLMLLSRDLLVSRNLGALPPCSSWKSRHNKHVHVIHPHLRGLGSRRPIQHHFLPAVRLGNDQRSIYISIERRKYRGGI